jgi:hypothetical protein
VLLYGDLDESGGVQLIEAYRDRATQALLPDRSMMAVVPAMPFVQEHISSFETYGTSTVAQIYGDRLVRASKLEATTLASMLFLNRGDHFEAHPLPAEAQWSPAFGVSVGDLDGDGLEDVFLSQNFFAVAPDYTRHDAGCGLWLRGDGRGGFTALSGQASGVTVFGEQRGCALGDFDHDGRVDLAVTQNGTATKLFYNRRARPGLRVKLAGPPSNPAGFGVVLRLGDGTRWGPAREVHGGAGYWSLDAATQVLCFAGEARKLQVRWPGAQPVTVDVPPNARGIEVNLDCAVRVLAP